jgi:ERCC4-type nuclease
MAIVSALIDQREPEWCQQLSFGGVPVVVTLLDAGDLLVATYDSCLLAIERKSANDLLNTLRDNRLFPQLARLRDVSPWAYLVVCGTLQPGPGGLCVADGRSTGWNWASVQGALLTVQEMGVHVLHVASDADYEAAVIRLANRDRSALRVAPARDVTIVSEQEQILASLPGIGAEKARALLAEFGSAHLALHYLTVWDRYWHHQGVAGIGDGIRRRVRKALGLDDELYLMAGVFSGNGEKTNE